MFKFYLFNDSLNASSIEQFIEYIEKLLLICTEEKKEDDDFLYHNSLWGHNTDLGVITDLLFKLIPVEYSQNIVPKILRSFNDSENLINNIDDFNRLFPDTGNAFLGLDFSVTSIAVELQITDSNSFNKFKVACANASGKSGFWERREILFPKLIMCEEVEEQIKTIGGSKHYNQVLEKLRFLNAFAQDWKRGDFSYKTVCARYPLVISPESEETLVKYSGERTFSLPDGRREVFELHIKTGDLRFHFFPDNNSHIIYVGYIGVHLPIASEK